MDFFGTTVLFCHIKCVLLHPKTDKKGIKVVIFAILYNRDYYNNRDYYI